MADLEFEKISLSFIEYEQFCKQSSKNTNLSVYDVFARQIRIVKGLGIENITSIVKVFRTPMLLYGWFYKWKNEAQALNLLNSAKHELLRWKMLGLNEAEINLGDVVKQAKPKIFNEMIKSSEEH